MTRLNADELILNAKAELERGSVKDVYKILLPLISARHPEALFLYSTFSCNENESDSEFEQRSINLLMESADLGFAPAIYALGVYFDMGHLVPMDQAKAAMLYEKASNLDHPKAKYAHGLNLLYGSHGFNKDVTNGTRLISEASIAGDDNATEFISEYRHLFQQEQ